MQSKKRKHPKTKHKLHPRNKHRQRYDFAQLIESCPGLATFVTLNKYGDESIDFFDPAAVKMLNRALLQHYYGIGKWDIPENYLCPPIPGRADYIHHVAELLGKYNNGKIPQGSNIKCLDIGVGASCVYPIIGNKEYGWSFVGSDIDPVSINSANKIIEENPFLKDKVELRLQKDNKDIFRGIIQKNEYFDLTICNPPFHASLEASQAALQRKVYNLKNNKTVKPIANFGGQNREIWCEGGEKIFVQDMVLQSKEYANSCFWFSTLISKKINLKNTYEALRNVNAVEVKTIAMGQGNKTGRIVAWTFLEDMQQREWRDMKWS